MARHLDEIQKLEPRKDSVVADMAESMQQKSTATGGLAEGTKNLKASQELCVSERERYEGLISQGTKDLSLINNLLVTIKDYYSTDSGSTSSSGSSSSSQGLIALFTTLRDDIATDLEAAKVDLQTSTTKCDETAKDYEIMNAKMTEMVKGVTSQITSMKTSLSDVRV